MKNILITGGSGLIGNKITQLLERKAYQVAWLSRNPERYAQQAFAWDLDKMVIDQKCLEWADVIIHLAGEGVADKRWTAKRKKSILESRTRSTQLLAQAISKAHKEPNLFISASGINYYGLDSGDQLVTEQSEPGNDFLAQVVIAWEKEAETIVKLGIRTVCLRTGVVLDGSGGALKEMMKPPVTAPLGNGKQWMSWIQIEDLARMYLFVIENENLSGIYNAVSPKPVSNHELTEKTAKILGKIFVPIGVPAFLLKIVLGEMALMVLNGVKASSKKIEETGFQFRYPTLDEALDKTFQVATEKA